MKNAELSNLHNTLDVLWLAFLNQVEAPWMYKNSKIFPSREP